MDNRYGFEKIQEKNFMKEEFVYVFHSTSLPYMVKIGYSYDCRQRIKELNCSLPSPFRVVKKWKVKNAGRLEKEIHKQLDFCRIASNREFFGISFKKAIEIIDVIVADGIYDRFSPSELKPLIKVDNVMELGKLIQKERKRQKLTQKQLAFASGTGLRVIGEIERGKKSAQVGIIFKILPLLKINIFSELN